MKKKQTILEFYKQCVEKGVIPKDGLCGCFEHDMQKLCMLDLYFGRGFMCGCGYWGYDGQIGVHVHPNVGKAITRSFTPMRQNVVLLMAALNGEFDE